MPIGDPHGGLFAYTTEGLPRSTFMCSVPSPDPQKASGFYTGTLKMDLLFSSSDEAVVRRERCTIRIFRSSSYGIDTGMFIGVDNPYDFHRRMIDEGVRFKMDPKRLPMGVVTSFFDNDGNILYAMETGAIPEDDDKPAGGSRS